MIVPETRAEATGWRIITWALCGNDDGGLYGERDNWSYLPGNGERTTRTAIRWWLRNPFHNLFWHVLNWPRERALVLYDTQNGFLCERPTQQWLDGQHFQCTLAPFFIGWRAFIGGAGWQSYFGFRDKEGLFGWSPLKRWRP